MKIRTIFLFVALLLGCEGELPPAPQDATVDATVSDADASTDAREVSVGDASAEASADASVPRDTNPLRMDAR